MPLHRQEIVIIVFNWIVAHINGRPQQKNKEPTTSPDLARTRAQSRESPRKRRSKEIDEDLKIQQKSRTKNRSPESKPTHKLDKPKKPASVYWKSSHNQIELGASAASSSESRNKAKRTAAIRSTKMDNNCDELDLNVESHDQQKPKIHTSESPNEMLKAPLQSLVISGERPYLSDVELPSIIEKYMGSGKRNQHSSTFSLQSMPHGHNSNLNDLSKF